MSKRGFDRSARIAYVIQQAVAHILVTEMMDERFRLVTITGVVVSPDCSYAKIYVSVLSDDAEKTKKIIYALNNAAKKMRYQLAREVDLRVMPALKFIYDESTANGFKISNLIDVAIKKIEDK